MSTPTFIPRYAAAVDTCDYMIGQLRRQIEERVAELHRWEARRERAIQLAEQNTETEETHARLD